MIWLKVIGTILILVTIFGVTGFGIALMFRDAAEKGRRDYWDDHK